MLDSYTQIGRDPNATTIRASFAATQGWEEQYRLLIQLGKQLPPLPVEWQTEDHRLHGCESHTWLLAEERGGLWHFACDSDARIVRGLIVIVLAALNRQSSAARRGDVRPGVQPSWLSFGLVRPRIILRIALHRHSTAHDIRSPPRRNIQAAIIAGFSAPDRLAAWTSPSFSSHSSSASSKA